MKKILLLFIFLFANQFAFSQIVGISYGQFQGNFSKLNAQLTTWGATKTWKTFNTVGITFGAILNAAHGRTFDAAFCFEKNLSQKTYIGDSLKYDLYGWHLLTSIYGIRIIHKKHFAFTAGPGIDWGVLKITGNLNGQETHYRNPFISPFARAEVRCMFWKIAFGFRTFYRLDISGESWSQDNNKLPDLNASEITGLGLQFFIGYGYSSN